MASSDKSDHALWAWARNPFRADQGGEPSENQAATNRRESVRMHGMVPPIHDAYFSGGFTLENSNNAPTGKYLDVAWACISSVSVLATCFPSELPSVSRALPPVSFQIDEIARLS